MNSHFPLGESDAPVTVYHCLEVGLSYSLPVHIFFLCVARSAPLCATHRLTPRVDVGSEAENLFVNGSVVQNGKKFPQLSNANFFFFSEYVVGFWNYSTSENRTAQLQGILGSSGGKWRILPRSNPASSFPSDFSVVYVRDACFSFVTNLLLLVELTGAGCKIIAFSNNSLCFPSEEVFWGSAGR